MQALEQAESGATGDTLLQYIAQAQLAGNLTDDLYSYIVDKEEEVTDADLD